MAQRNFSSPLRISAIADITLILLVIHAAGILSHHISANAARNTNSKHQRVDDGGIKVPSSLPGKERQIIAVRNQPLTLRCPIVIADDVRILDLWWMKDGVKLDLYPSISATTTNSGQQQTNSQQQHQSQLQTSTQAQYNPPSSAASTSTSSVVLVSAPRVMITNEGDLHFEKINHKVINSGQRHKNYSDEGDYRCVIKTPLGVVLGPVSTVSVAPPIDTRSTEEVKAKSGEPILLECQIASPSAYHSLSSSDLQFTWIRSDNVTITQEIDVRYNILSSGTLAISNVSPRDAGEFRCIVKDKSSNSQRVSYVNLVVLPGNDNVSSEPPKIISTRSFDGSKTVLILDEEENAILDCIASGIPKPVINWLVAVMNENGTISLQVSHGSPFRNSINISSELARGTEGNFSCIADNGIGEPVTRTLQVFRLPALQAEPESYQYPAAKTVRFECKVPPLFSLVWYKDGQLLETGKGRVKTKGNELVVSNTIRNDSGFYQCEVIADDRVYAIGTARLLVNNNREAPDAPTNVGCLERHPTALTVSWTPPVKFEDIISFTIHYMPTRGEERQRVVPPRTTNITVQSLQPHTDYSIYIRSYSTKSASAQSVPVICRTREDVPVNRPPSVEQEHYGPPSQVRLTWRPLSNRDARGKIILYKLQWRSVNGEFSNVRYIDGDSQEFIITDLSADQEYEYRLIPSTSIGWPTKKDTWSWMPISVGEFDANSNSTNEDYFVPPSLHLTVLNSTSVLVNWSEPPRPKEVHVKGFRITYSTKSDRVDDVVFFGPITLYEASAREYLFTNLAPGSNYEFYLQTWGEDWESTLASKFIGTFPDSEGGLIDNLPVITGMQVHPISSHEVRLKWDQPLINSSEGYFYTVKYNKVDSGDVYFISSTRESVEIKGLDPYTSYEFVVQLTLKDGRVGPYSQKIESRTLSGTPGAPGGLHWRVHNQSVIEVEWTPPLAPNGIITKYWVEFRLNKTENQNGTNNNGASTPKREWNSKSTSNTSIFLNDLQRNEGYVVRVKAETKAGVGEPSEIAFVKIFNRKPPEQPPSGDQPKPDSNTLKPNDQQRLGIVIGIALSAVFISLCVTIILCRNRFFPLISRSPPGALYVNGNGHPPRTKRSLESLNCVEMKVLVGLTGADGHTDTKASHPVANGSVPTVTDPLLVHVTRNGPNRQDDQEEETIPNCVH